MNEGHSRDGFPVGRKESSEAHLGQSGSPTVMQESGRVLLYLQPDVCQATACSLAQLLLGVCMYELSPCSGGRKRESQEYVPHNMQLSTS